MEQISNNAVTTLAQASSTVDGTITVTSAAAFPLLPQFKIVVGSGDFSDAEIMTVTAVAGNVFTVTRASEPTAGVQAASIHPIGSTVAQSITSDGFFTASRETSLGLAIALDAIGVI